MIKIENGEVVGLEHVVRGMRNPLNSWSKSDSKRESVLVTNNDTGEQTVLDDYIVGANDLDLMKRLSAAGPSHAKYKRMMIVYVDFTAPLYFYKELDQYKVGTVSNSCSTMHKIHSKELTIDDFSHEHLNDDSIELLKQTINLINTYRKSFLSANKSKQDWWQMIQLLPSSYNQKRTYMLNYEVLSNIYHTRKDHKLDEWHTVCDWIESLPYSEIITDNKNS